MARTRHGPPDFTCIKNCTGAHWELRQMVQCSYCPNYFHSECVGIGQQQAIDEEWSCPTCDARVCSIPLNEDDLPNIPSQRVNELAIEANRTFQDISANVTQRSGNSGTSSQLANHIRNLNERITRSNQPSTSRNQVTPTENDEPVAGPSHDIEDSDAVSSQDSDATVTSTSSTREYYVQSILAHGKATDGTLLYKVRWRGYAEADDTWEPETQFVKLYDKLAEYKRRNRLGPPTFPKKYGFTNMAKGNDANWITGDKIISTALGFIPKEFRDKIPVCLIRKPQALHDIDHVYLIDYQNHALVGLYYANLNIMYIADGENSFQKDPEIRNFIQEWFAIPIRAIEFIHQYGVDHCASSSAMIICKFIELYARGQSLPRTLTTSKVRHDYIRKMLHPEPSEQLNEWKPINFQKEYKCDHPGCSFSTKRRDARVIKRHQLNHN